MILVMNKKHGVGCTTLTYNLGRLFEIPIYVKDDSFMIDNEHKDIFENVSKITSTKKDGIFDIGADLKKTYVKKLITNQAKVIVIPMEFGYESIISTIETIKYIQELDIEKSNNLGYEFHTPIVLILNRLDKQDSARDFNYKDYLKLKFEEADISFNRDSLILTYLRNSYGVYSNLDIGEYFLDKFIKQQWKEDREFNNKNIENFEYKKFLYLVSEALSKTDYKNEKIYIQDKDMVVFRNDFKERYEKYTGWQNRLGRHSFKILDRTKAYREEKLIKDMAFISYIIFKYIVDEDNEIKRYMYRSW